MFKCLKKNIKKFNTFIKLHSRKLNFIIYLITFHIVYVENLPSSPILLWLIIVFNHVIIIILYLPEIRKNDLPASLFSTILIIIKIIFKNLDLNENDQVFEFLLLLLVTKYSLQLHSKIFGKNSFVETVLDFIKKIYTK